jgi:hypothetical protein
VEKNIAFKDKKLSDRLIKLIRTSKINGFSLSEISNQYHVAKSTASIYCRDLFYYPGRKYKTEQEFRQGILDRQRGKDHHGYHPCIDCSKMIGDNRHMRCRECYLKIVRSN